MFNEEFKITANNENMLYVKMAIKNVDFALISLDYILNTEIIDRNVYEDEHTFYFYYIQNLLAACGNLNNILNNSDWHYVKRKTDQERLISPKERSKELCCLCNLNLKEYSLIFKKEARNTNMHFDERYDEYNRRIGDYNILDKNTPEHVRYEILNTPHLRTYDKQAQVYITVNKNREKIEFPLRQLRQELVMLKGKLLEVENLNAD